MEFQIKKVEKGDIDTEELKKQIPGWCSLLKKSPDDERLRIIVEDLKNLKGRAYHGKKNHLNY